MLAHALDVGLRAALVRDAYLLCLALTELLHYSEVCFLWRRLERGPCKAVINSKRVLVSSKNHIANGGTRN